MDFDTDTIAFSTNDSLRSNAKHGVHSDLGWFGQRIRDIETHQGETRRTKARRHIAHRSVEMSPAEREPRERVAPRVVVDEAPSKEQAPIPVTSERRGLDRLRKLLGS